MHFYLGFCRDSATLEVKKEKERNTIPWSWKGDSQTHGCVAVMPSTPA